MFHHGMYKYMNISIGMTFITYCVCIRLSMCKQVQTSTNKYIQVQTSTNSIILLYTGIYLYVLVCTGTKRIAKECITIGFEPMTSCILSPWSNRCATSVESSVVLSVFWCNINLSVSIPAVCHLAVGVGHPALAPPRPPCQPWDAGPGPLMDSKISQKPRLATKQGSELQTRNCRAAARRRPCVHSARPRSHCWPGPWLTRTRSALNSQRDEAGHSAES